MAQAQLKLRVVYPESETRGWDGGREPVADAHASVYGYDEDTGSAYNGYLFFLLKFTFFSINPDTLM